LEYEYHFDPTKPGSIVARHAVNDVLQTAAGRHEVAKAQDTEHTEPGGRYIDFLVPGLLGMGLMGGGLWGVGFVTVDMRIRKLLKRFLATPMKKSHFLAAVMASRMLFMIPEVLVMLLFAWLVFGVKIRGSLLVIALLILVGAVMFSGLGLLVASRARTLEAVSGLMNLVMLPMWVLSGIFFSSERFPDAVQPAIKLLPLTPLIDSLRAVMLEAETVRSLAPELTIMIVWTVLSFALALRWFRWI
jgi:ABC-type multidrug transport system permease subunit